MYRETNFAFPSDCEARAAEAGASPHRQIPHRKHPTAYLHHPGSCRLDAATSFWRRGAAPSSSFCWPAISRARPICSWKSGESGWYPNRPEPVGRPSFPSGCRTTAGLLGTSWTRRTTMSRHHGRSGSPSRQTPNRYHPDALK